MLRSLRALELGWRAGTVRSAPIETASAERAHGGARDPNRTGYLRFTKPALILMSFTGRPRPKDRAGRRGRHRTCGLHGVNVAL